MNRRQFLFGIASVPALGMIPWSAPEPEPEPIPVKGERIVALFRPEATLPQKLGDVAYFRIKFPDHDIVVSGQAMTGRRAAEILVIGEPVTDQERDWYNYTLKTRLVPRGVLTRLGPYERLRMA